MLLSKPMKTTSDEMKGEKKKIKASSKKEGFPWEPIGKGDFDSSAFCAVLSSSSRAAGTSGRRSSGRPTPEVAVLGMVSTIENSLFNT